MKKILIAGFQHETNTFGATKAQFKDFEEADSWPALLSDNEVLSGTEHINLPISGFVEALRGDANFPLVPVVWASAEPSSFVTDDAFNRISKMILSGIRRNPGISGIYLDLHGAMVTESFQDGEGELLRRIREVVGNE
ncbi:MAG: microcystin degradation protein MlrC, partial [Proteobacteria bacterium]|nr:microcystin degradation protein MlrC [Pseudomonadota bacterium]